MNDACAALSQAEGAPRYADHATNFGRVALASAGFMTDAYDLWVINIVTEMMQVRPSAAPVRPLFKQCSYY